MKGVVVLVCVVGLHLASGLAVAAPERSHKLQFNAIATLLHSRTGNATMGNATEHRSELGRCEQATGRAFSRLMNDSACASLFPELEKPSPDFLALCSNPCWDEFTSTLGMLFSIGCLDEDPATMASLCVGLSVSCESAEAEDCVGQWLMLGCPATHPREAECGVYQQCAIVAQLEGRCAPPPERASETPSSAPTAAPTTTPAAPAPHAPSCAHLNNCSRHGSCVNGHCECDRGYGRIYLSEPEMCAVWTLAHCPSNCSGHGDCVPGADGNMQCRCYNGFSGDKCDVWDGCLDFNFCNGNGVCTRTFLEGEQEHCVCNPGFSGDDCTTVHQSCPDNCFGRGACEVDSATGARWCSCEPGLTGPNCGLAVTNHCPSQCSGHGRCTAGGNCSCTAGAVGSDCSHFVNLCSHSCGHGYCRSQACECAPGFKGEHCNVYDAGADLECAALNFCSGLGVCFKNRTNAAKPVRCVCFEGFTGDDCSSVDVASECPNFCNGHGRCQLVPSPHCHCDAKWSGPDCAEPLCPTNEDGAVCSGRGVCEAQRNNTFGCVCDDGRVNGPRNACEKSNCPNECSEHGICLPDGSCSCVDGYGGEDCATSVPVAPEEGANAEGGESAPGGEGGSVAPAPTCLNDCDGHGQCNEGVCACVDGYSGEDCSIAPIGVEDEDDGLGFLMQTDEGSGDDVAPRASMAGLWN